MLGLDLKTFLTLSAFGAAISTFGTLLGIFIKDYFFARSFEKWKQRQTLESIYQRYRDPLFLSACELASRLVEVDEHYPTVYLRSSVLESDPERQIQNSIDDPYFKRHKLISTVYRMNSLLGWLELYRHEVTHLRSGTNCHSKALEASVNLIRSTLADGQINRASDWQDWRDTLIFRDELRAIGESMHDLHGNQRYVIGYGRFCERIETEEYSSAKRWLPVTLNFFLDLDMNDKDFRKIRIKKLIVNLVDLMTLLDKRSIPERLAKKRKKIYVELKEVAT